MLRRLSIFVFGLSRDMACTIASDIGTSESDAVEALAGLVAKSLLNADANTSVRTYRLLETTLAYAHAELRQTSSVRKLRAGTQSISCIGLLPQKLAYSQRQLLVSSPISPPLLTIVRAAVAWASSPDGDVAIRVALMAATAPLWIRSSLYAECRNHVERALASEVLANGHYTRQEMQLSAALAQC